MPGFVTKYLPPTNHRGSRIKVRTLNNSHEVEFAWRPELNVVDNHIEATLETCRYLRMWGSLSYQGVMHYTACDSGFVFVFENSNPVMVNEEEEEVLV